MVRKTKEEALATRGAILDAAERLFQTQGVSRTSLHDIAVAAGVTRGAIYWHFKDKSAVFDAMMERVCLPLEESAAQFERDYPSAPLPALRKHMLTIFERVAGDEQVRRVFEIATHKVEYVGELNALRERHLEYSGEYQALLEKALRVAQKRGDIGKSPPARVAAIGLHALLKGLMHNWMLDPTAYDLLAVARQTLDVHLAGLAARREAVPA
jgi:TetR/AcrR family acrAB operon transcriptional repressor